jgi:hypothetical protein
LDKPGHRRHSGGRILGVAGALAPGAAVGDGAIVWWLEQEQSCSPEQLAHWLNQFIYDISVSSLKLKG